MTIELKPEQERIIQEEIQNGHFRTADEVLDRTLAALRDKEHRPPAEGAEIERVRRAQSAAAHIRELSKGLSLEGLNIKDLIEEGRNVSEFVLDASLAVAWCFESEANPYTKAILTQMGQGGIAWVPVVWKWGVLNALLKATRQLRLSISRAEEFCDLSAGMHDSANP